MKKTISFAVILIWLGSLSAQSFVGRNNYHLESSPRFSNSSDTLKILAVMVEFQKDNDRNTYGNGKFGSIYSQNYGTEIIDPLPFDANYFSNHLEFAKNYFKKVSNGKLNIVYKILPQVITVPDSMRNYSPPPQNASDFSGLGKFTKEVWQLADAAFPNEDFSKYNLFTIFHAGVGREAPKLSSIENERDLPSVYLGLKSLQSILGNDFNGFPVDGGKFLITNTMILPSTESHEESTFSGTMLVKATINGILVGNIGTYLGLPDLFNTVTGVSSVGRFGLMDGDALFAYSGLFPPEPSAWEKVYLGWATPVTLSIGDKNVNLAARIAATLNDTTILKIPINSTEYFLIENRERDVNKDGLVITAKEGSQTFTFNIDRDKGKFQWYQADTLKGVITDVDEPDWAAPGNGIVIWHIDDNIINANIADDKINADDNHRGIYVEEADGIFDIGKKITTLLGEDYGRAAQEDMWYAGNKGKYFKNIFGPDSKPNTNSNTGANSLITMRNFSAAANKMGFNVSFSSLNIKLVSATKFTFSPSDRFLSSNGYAADNNLYLVANSALLKLNVNGKQLNSAANFTSMKPVVFQYHGVEYVLGAFNQTLNIYYNVSGKDVYKSLDILSPITALAVDNNGTEIPKILIGAANGESYAIALDVLLGLTQFTPATYSFYKDDGPVINFGVDHNFYSVLLPNSLKLDQVYPLNAASKKLVMTKDSNGKYVAVVLCADNQFYVFGAETSSFVVKSQTIINDFSVADLFGDGQNYILIGNGSSLEAYNLDGVMANNFPFTEPNGENFVGSPLAIDLLLDGHPDIISYTDHGNIYAYDPSTGKIVNGFPISTGIELSDSPMLFGKELPTMGPLPVYKPYLAAFDQSDKLYVWNIADSQNKIYWSGQFGNSMNASFAGAPSTTQKVADFFPASKAYNWPNPVYGGDTQIRYYVNENSDVNVKIFDLAGNLVAELNDKANGGFDNETTWDVSKVQSGIYYAHLEVKGGSGASASKIIKIAVIK
ncbi:MAG: T9SS type A sorting domain-containing protein [Bacteroidetes bacterium]|nr:T9SS type A sorting domain-containing protein [Bacteroidota bacterium]